MLIARVLLKNQNRGMKSYIQILGTFTSDTTPSIVVHYDSQRYLFNCGEGTQRLLTEHKIRMGKLKNVFLTHMDWRYSGGIPGIFD
jgi:ribonuclease Z